MSELRVGDAPPGFRSGFASIVGRPNVGKSTLLNQILRSKVVITSDRPQTTRNAVRGVLTTAAGQVVFVDTPGLHKPRTLLGERLNDIVRRTLAEVDAVVLMLDASQQIGRGDAFVAASLSRLETPVIAVLNKTDLIDAGALASQREEAARLGDFDSVVAVSARSGEGTGALADLVVRAMPEGPVFYPPDVLTDQPERVLVAELIREKVLELTREEVPHSVAVLVEEIRRGEGRRVEVDAVVYVERESQKGIVIGHKGGMLKEAGTRARRDIERLLGNPIHLRLRVKVERDWQKRLAIIERFGYAT